jgi:adenosine kinase
MTILCTGSVAYDYLMSFPGYFKEHILPDHLESISLSFLVESMVKRRGGTAPNIAYTLALLGNNVSIMATVGQDFEGYRSWLISQGVGTEQIKVVEDKYTASFFATTDRSNAQIASFYPGAMADAAQLSLKDLTAKPKIVVISPNDPGAMAKYVKECIELDIPYLYDPSQQVVSIDHEELKEGALGAYCLFVNEYETELLLKHTGLKLDQILEKVRFMVTTLGEKGALIYADGKKYQVPVVEPKQILDPTGVGDAFRGGFLSGFVRGYDWETCGKMGSLAAAYCLEQEAPQDHCYSCEEFIARYRENFDDQGLLDTLLQD